VVTTPDTAAICRKMAEEIWGKDAYRTYSIFQPHPSYRLKSKEDVLKALTSLLLTHTDLPKIIRALCEIANTETYPPEFRYGGPANINIQIGAWHQEQFHGVVKKAIQVLTDLRGDQPKQSGGGDETENHNQRS